MKECCQNPRFFFCECVAVESEGTVTVILACTNCGSVKHTTVQVAKGPASLRLLKEEKGKS